MIKNIVIKEILMISRTRLVLFYISYSLFLFLALIFFLFHFGSQDVFSTLMVYLLNYILLIGYGAFYWRWDSEEYQLFYVKGKIEELVRARIIFYIVTTIIISFMLIGFFSFLDDEYYVRISYISALHSSGIAGLLALYILSFDISYVNLFDRSIIILRNSTMSYLGGMVMVLFAFITYFSLEYLQYIYILIINVFLTLMVFLTFYRKVEKAISNNIRKYLIKNGSNKRIKN